MIMWMKSFEMGSVPAVAFLLLLALRSAAPETQATSTMHTHAMSATPAPSATPTQAKAMVPLEARLQKLQQQRQLCTQCDCFALRRNLLGVLERAPTAEDLEILEPPAVQGSTPGTTDQRPHDEVLVINCTGRLEADRVSRWSWPSRLSAGQASSNEIWAEFIGGNLGGVHRLPSLPFRLTRLSLAGNKLRFVATSAFANLVHLKQLDLSFNRVAAISKESLQGMSSLQRLDLSHNSLGTNQIPADLLSGLSNLTELNLRNNSVSGELNGDTLPWSGSLLLLDLSHNQLSSVSAGAWNRVQNLKDLDLSWNNIRTLTPQAFSGLGRLERLDLSHNPLTSTPSDVLEKLGSLRVLDVSHCTLGRSAAAGGQEWRTEAALRMPPSLEHLRASGCGLGEFVARSWGGLQNLRRLDVSVNGIAVLDDLARLDLLQELNASHNEIVRFPTVTLPALEVLDLSYNQLESAPGLSGSLTPRLVALTLDGNPMEEMRLRAPSSLRMLSVKHMPRLQVLPENAVSMDGPESTNTTASPDDGEAVLGCGPRLALWASHNPMLSRVHGNALHGLPLCQLDLSYNDLSRLPEELAHWETLDVIDLQGNPWSCTCTLQWVLDSLVRMLYRTRPHLLQDLRCAGPEGLEGLRLVHWYNHTGPVLCGSHDDMVLHAGFGAGSGKVTLGVSTAGLVIIVCTGLVLLGLVGLGIVAQRRHIIKRRTRNRRL